MSSFPMRPKAIVCALLLLLAASARAQDDVPARAMKDELARSISEIQLQKMDKPYFLAYRMDEINRTAVSATLGSVTEEQPSRMRLIGVEVRVGDYALDNSNYVSLGSLGRGGAGMFSSISEAPLDDNYQQIRRDFWLATDSQYKKALEDLSAKRAALEMRQHKDDIPDFTKESPNTETQPPEKTQANLEELKALSRALSAVFRSTPDIYSSSVDLEYRNYYTRYINSEGSSFTRAQPVFKLQISAQTQSPDGLPISDSIELYGRTIADLPAQGVLLSRTRAMADRILKLRSAAAIDRYNGPVLFEGDASAEIFTQQFATGLMAVRTPLSDDSRFEMFFNQMMSQLGGASFIDKIGGRVLPDFLSVTDNPLQPEYKGVKLLGASTIDDDAVKTRETKLVDHGVAENPAGHSRSRPLRAAQHRKPPRMGSRSQQSDRHRREVFHRRRTAQRITPARKRPRSRIRHRRAPRRGWGGRILHENGSAHGSPRWAGRHITRGSL